MASLAMMIVGASAASAATFNFVSMADNAGDANYIGATELNWADTAFAGGLTIDGVTLIASGSNLNGTFADAFFDKGNAGLGVCSTIGPVSGGSGCATGVGSNTGDDNVSAMAGGETLTLDFGRTIDVTDITFRNESHNPVNGSLDVVGLGTLTIFGGSVTAGAELLSGQSSYSFRYTGDEFYVSSATVSAVPLPAGVALMFTGLAALGAVGRRRKRLTA